MRTDIGSRRAIVIFVAGILVTGCASQFTPLRGQNQAQLEQDTKECKEQAQVPLGWACAWGGPWFVALPMLAGCGIGWAVSEARITTETDLGKMWACMEARGYQGARPAR